MESIFTDLKNKAMTEQEAFNDPEMKTILVLSGYVRELREGKDYEETTYKTAETIVKIFSMHNVSNSIATEYAEFCVRCDREKLPLLCLEDYIEQYCC